MSEVKEKPRLFTYVAFWSLPRSQWADEQKLVVSEKGMLDKSVAGGNLVGYGDDTNLVHQPDGSTHDDWFSSMSMAGLLNVLDGIYKSPMVSSPVEASSTRHADFILVSRFTTGVLARGKMSIPTPHSTHSKTARRTMRLMFSAET